MGVGYDAHRFVEGRPLVLGGVEIPYRLGLAGHSDADVVTHAVVDAVLGAAGMADIGVLFPDADPVYKDADSVTLLERAVGLVREGGWQVGNVDVVIVLEEPRLAEHRQGMRQRLAEALDVGTEDVWVKAKTTEGMGFEGRREGVSATAVCLLRRR
ncbi:MAG TPA: 2-C-methyl-D-erythritol 2,4-cyclodiphosphate synthase [Thermoleophilia bacterium]|nr:2-C-methyl-D-erythritol 2,4-cyclodiphosphate synthase [Thermoleophilia bacterium]